MTVKIYTMSDLHIDYKANLKHLLSLNDPLYKEAGLIVAGDATDSLEILEQLLSHFKTAFAEVYFVPGNHELWVQRSGESDSVAKFWAIVELCRKLGVHTQPFKMENDDDHLWVVPLFSWYTKPQEGGDSLFEPKPVGVSPTGEIIRDETDDIWSDNYYCRWPDLGKHKSVVDFFFAQNEERCARRYDAPVISFSHFLPRKGLMFPVRNWRQWIKTFKDPMPQFNFTRVAGSTKIETQIRQLGSLLHIYGHQHRERWRKEDGVTYVSHCLGYPNERTMAHWSGNDLPLLVWDGDVVTVEKEY